MPSARRFPPPWIIEENNDACFIVRDANGQALGYFYFRTTGWLDPSFGAAFAATTGEPETSRRQ